MGSIREVTKEFEKACLIGLWCERERISEVHDSHDYTEQDPVSKERQTIKQTRKSLAAAGQELP